MTRIHITPEELEPKIVITAEELDQPALHAARAENGRINISPDKGDVYQMTSGAPDPNSDRAHWPITNPIPDDPEKATRYHEQRRQQAVAAEIGPFAVEDFDIRIK